MKPSKDMWTIRKHLQEQFRRNHGKDMAPRQLTAAARAVSGKLAGTSVDNWLKGQVIRYRRGEDYKIKPFLREVDI